ncbi:hypothetical protein HK096_000458, partial [Nowakowskiella sp. JEL0078]
MTLEAFSSLMLLPKVKETYLDSILETEKFSHGLAPRVILLMKKIMDSIEGTLSEIDQTKFSVVLQSSVSSLLDSLTETWETLQSQDFDPTWMKNILLSVVLITTSCPLLSFNPENQTRLCDTLQRLLRSPVPQLSLMSLHCIRSLLLLSNRAEPEIAGLGAQFIQNLVPSVVVLVMQSSKSLLKAPDADKAQAASIDEDTEQKKTSLLSFIVPVFINMLSEIKDGHPCHSSNIAKTLHVFCAQTLLQLATERPQMFKKAINGLPAAKGTKLEQTFK